MGTGFPVGRIRGVEIRLDWSLLLIAALIATSLATTVFPDSLPGRPSWVDWSLAAVATALFYASILGHELAHAVVARAHGVEVSGITLWMLGGVSQLRGDVRTPGDEARISGVGPAVSLAAGALFWVAAVALRAVGAGDARWSSRSGSRS